MMRCSKFVLGVVALVTVSVTAALAAPVPGVYRSIDLAGTLFTGRASQSWIAPANAANGNGDVYNSESWNGALGTQWAMQCGHQTAPQLVQDNRFAGTGTVQYTNAFHNGNFYFVSGPWCSSALCTGALNLTIEVVTVQYVSFIPYAAVVNINTSGVFAGGQCNLTFAIANGVGQGDTDGGPFPPPGLYPALLDLNCNPTRAFGSWGDVITITAKIDCPTAVKSSSWGQLKTQYR